MPRTYAKLLVSIWQDPDFRQLDADAQRLYLYLISQPDLTHCGAIPMRVRRWAGAAPDLTLAHIGAAVCKLRDARFVVIDPDTEELLVRSFMRHDGAAVNSNLRKAMELAIGQIESRNLQTVAVAELARASQKDPPRGDGGGDGVPPPEPPITGDAESTSSSPTPFTSSSAAADAPDPAAKQTPPDKVIAAAIQILIDHRIIHSRRPIEDEEAYGAQIRRNLTADQKAGLTREAQYTDDPAEVAASVFNIRPPAPPPAAHDPDCPHCDGTGIIIDEPEPGDRRNTYARRCGEPDTYPPLRAVGEPA